jgi:hypothetical protein
VSRGDPKAIAGASPDVVPYFDARFWSTYFVSHFVAQTRFFCDALEKRVLPAFATADSEANTVAEAEFERLMTIPPFEDGPVLDTSQAAEAATDAGISRYLMVQDTRQVFLNLSAAALYHMLEQQLLVFHRRQVLPLHEEHDPTLNADVGILFERLARAGVKVDALPSWRTIDELRLAANVIKHGEGPSARKLREVRPQLLFAPSLQGLGTGVAHRHVSQPLAGLDVYVTVSDIRRYRDGLSDFWRELSDALLGVERP